MKLTTEQLRQIIREELKDILLNEARWGSFRQKGRNVAGQPHYELTEPEIRGQLKFGPNPTAIQQTMIDKASEKPKDWSSWQKTKDASQQQAALEMRASQSDILQLPNGGEGFVFREDPRVCRDPLLCWHIVARSGEQSPWKKISRHKTQPEALAKLQRAASAEEFGYEPSPIEKIAGPMMPPEE